MAKPKIPNVRWRGEVAWARIKKGGQVHEQSLETENPRVARERVEQLRKELEATRWGEKPRRTFDEAASKFIDEHLPRLRPRTRASYLQALSKLADTFEGKTLDEIGSGLLSDFESKRRAEGVQGGTIRNDLFCLSAVFSCAMEWEWVAGNPVAAYLRGRKKRGLLVEQPPRTRYLSHDEERELYVRAERIGGTRPHLSMMLRAAMALTIDLGLRKEELLNATWLMVDFDLNEWVVPRDMDKSGFGRRIPILERSRRILQALPRSPLCPYVLWRPERPKEGQPEKHGRYFDLLPMLMEIATGGRSVVFKREATKLGLAGEELTEARRAAIAVKQEREAWAEPIPDLNWHDLRRTCGCRLLQDYRMPIEKVSRWLGHHSIAVTQEHYAFLEIKHLHSAAAASAEDQRRISSFIEGRLPPPDAAA